MTEIKQSSIDTVAFSQPVTAQNILPTQDLRVAAPATNQTQQNVRIVPQVRRSSSKGLIAVAVIFPILFLMAAGGGGVWLYVSSKRNAVNEERHASTAIEEKKPDQTKADLTEPRTETPAQASENVDADAAKREVADLVEHWKDLTEGHNAEKLSKLYGEKVDYLGESGVSAEAIKAELQKKFDAYSEIDIEITNLTVAVDSEVTAATALFDEEWSYVASPKLSEGKAHMKLHLQKAGKDWKIVTEKQLKVYYTEN